MKTIQQTRRSVLVLLIACSSAWSFQDSEEASSKETRAQLSTGQVAPAATVNAIMSQAVNNIAIRYNLTAEQKQKTSELMERGVHKFLKDNEDVVWPVIRDLIQNRFKDPENEEDRKRVGRATGPLVKLAEEAILKANEEWRFLLSEEQKAVHDYDLSEMKKNFEEMDETLQSWADGRATDKGLFPRPKKSSNEPRRPSRPQFEGLPPAQKVAFRPDQIFEAIVAEFIKDYELAPGQITSARSILEEFKAMANDFKNSKKEELARISADLTAAHERRDVQAKKRLDAERKEIFSPVVQLTEQMGERLRNLLTTAQIQKHAEKSQSKSSARKKPRQVKKNRTATKRNAAVADSAKSEPQSDDDGG